MRRTKRTLTHSPTPTHSHAYYPPPTHLVTRQTALNRMRSVAVDDDDVVVVVAVVVVAAAAGAAAAAAAAAPPGLGAGAGAAVVVPLAFADAPLAFVGWPLASSAMVSPFRTGWRCLSVGRSAGR